MQAVKNRLNSMKAQSDLSEERIIKFESALSSSKHHLEAALKEKESLQRKIEAVETHIINADRQREDAIDKLKGLEMNTDASESKRKVLENRELEGDGALLKLEERLRLVRERFKENSVRCEETERRLAVLTADFQKVHARRVQLEVQGSCLEKEIDYKLVKLRDYESFDLNTSQEEYKQEDNMKLLESYYRDAEEKKELGRMDVMRLQRLIEQTQDDIEAVQIRTKTTKVELQNTIQAVVDN